MPRLHDPGFVATADDGAKLVISTPKLDWWAAHYTPAPKALTIASRHETFTPPLTCRLLLEGSLIGDVLITYPLVTNAAREQFLRPKYDRLLSITLEGFFLNGFAPSLPPSADELEDMLQGLPSGFVRNPYFGLGLNWDIRYLTEAVEEIEAVTDLRIIKGARRSAPSLSGTSYVIAASMFDDARKSIGRAHEKALTIAAMEKRTFIHNALLTTLDPVTYPEKPRFYQKNAIVEAIGNSLDKAGILSPADQAAVVNVTRASVRTLSSAQPAEMMALNREIELVTLESLIKRIKERLAKTYTEGEWQTFLFENPFVLRLAFGYPILMMGGQISVGGGRFDGSGDKISDFAIKAAASGNLALIEIKTTKTHLVQPTPYRGDLHAPGHALTAAVSQVLDQQYQLQKDISSRKNNSGVWDVESYAVQALVIAGLLPTSRAELKSLELYRNSLKSVTIVSFDELLCKLEQLHDFLTEETPSGAVEVAPSHVMRDLRQDMEEDLEENF